MVEAEIHTYVIIHRHKAKHITENEAKTEGIPFSRIHMAFFLNTIWNGPCAELPELLVVCG